MSLFLQTKYIESSGKSAKKENRNRRNYREDF